MLQAIHTFIIHPGWVTFLAHFLHEINACILYTQIGGNISYYIIVVNYIGALMSNDSHKAHIRITLSQTVCACVQPHAYSMIIITCIHNIQYPSTPSTN